MQFKATDKMCDLMCNRRAAEIGSSLQDEQILQLMNRFGITLGVGEKTIQTVCDEHQVDCNTMLTIVNYAIYKELPSHINIDIPTLHRYLENAHTYFLTFQLPRIRQELLEAINLANNSSKVPLMIIRFFDEYVQEIKSHIEHEAEHSYEQHARDDEHIANKAHELKSLIIKYYPSNYSTTLYHPLEQEQMRLLYAALHDLRHFENELSLHCSIEDNLMLPALRKEENRRRKSNQTIEMDTSDVALSNREIEVIKYVAQGKSNKEIADAMCLSTHTVISHRKNIAKKLNIHSTAGLTIYAVVNGIVEV